MGWAANVVMILEAEQLLEYTLSNSTHAHVSEFSIYKELLV